MTKLTRRSFLKQTSASAATFSLLPAAPALAVFFHPSPEDRVTDLSATLNGPIVVHVSDIASGEITLFVGDQETVFRDPQIVAHLIKAARLAG